MNWNTVPLGTAEIRNAEIGCVSGVSTARGTKAGLPAAEAAGYYRTPGLGTEE
jgi:hypothetical protein